jgi:hypothetical protein
MTTIETEIGLTYLPGRELPEHPRSWISACTSLGSDRLAFSLYDPGTILVLDARSGYISARFDGFAGIRGLWQDGHNRLIACQPDAHKICLLGEDGRILRTFTLEQIKPWHCARWGNRWLVVDADNRALWILNDLGQPIGTAASERPLREPRAAIPTGEHTFVVCDRRRAVVAELDEQGTWLWHHGVYANAGNDEASLASPEFVLPLSDGGFLICDTRNNRVLRRDRAGGIALFAGGHGRIGSAPGHLNQPVSAAECGGRIFVADAANGRIVQYDQSGAETCPWGEPVVARSMFQFPRCMEPTQEGYLVADSYNNRIALIDEAGQLRRQWSEALNKPFFWPRFATEIGEDRFFCDSRNGRVLRAESEQLVAFTLRQHGELVQMSDPHSVRAAPRGVSICDTDANRMVHVTREGEVLGSWGGEPHPIATSTPVRGHRIVEIADLHDGQFAHDETLWLVDTSNSRLLHIDQQGTVLATLSTLECARPGLAQDLRWPRSVEVLDQDRLLITDAGNHRVIVVTTEGEIVGQFGGRRGHARGHLSDPRFSRHWNGQVLITDYQNHRLVRVPLIHLYAFSCC